MFVDELELKADMTAPEKAEAELQIAIQIARQCELQMDRLAQLDDDMLEYFRAVQDAETGERGNGESALAPA